MKTDMLCILISEESEIPDIIDPKIDEAVSTKDQAGLSTPERFARELKKIVRAKPRTGKIAVTPTLGLLPADHILIGCLDGNASDPIRLLAATSARKAREMNLANLAVLIPEDMPGATRQAIEGVKLGLYKFDKFKTEKECRVPDLVICSSASQEVMAEIKAAESTADGVILTRDMANMPPNACTPAVIADVARRIATQYGMNFGVIEEPELTNSGFGGISAVGQGSKNGPRLITLEHKGGGEARPVVVVGKAVTFDTGGISIKPAANLDEMKFDKSGGCAILGIMQAAAARNLPLNVVGIIPAVENMPGGGSYRPGDIITLYSKKTAEIINTDAEGRLILADALAYGRKRYNPVAMIDLATLTGACIVALGNNVAGLVSNDDTLAEDLLRSSAETSEEIWRLPINHDYINMIKSKVADVRNMGIGRAAGAITAAAFLERAIGDTPWAHLDIAGVAWTQQATTERDYKDHGATGFGVRLILDYLSRL